MLVNKLKVARVINGDLTQQQLAELVSCSRQTIHSIESSKFIPSVELSLRIAAALGVTVEDIFSLNVGSNISSEGEPQQIASGLKKAQTKKD